jgi:hypothetical protein
MAMLPVSLPRTSFWTHAVAPDHDFTGNRELELAQERHRAGDRLASRAHLYRMQWASAAPSQALALRALSLECLLDAGDVVVGSMLLGGARRRMSAVEAAAVAATASHQTPAPAVPSWREQLLSKRWARRMGAAADPALTPWIELLDAWQCYQYADTDAAHDSWKQLAYADGLDPLVKGFAALGVVQTAAERLIATKDGVWLNEGLNAAGWAYSQFSAASNPGGCGQAQLLAAELNYLIRKVPMGRVELEGANRSFDACAAAAGLAEVNLISALGEGLNGNAEPAGPALTAAEDAVGLHRATADQIDALIEFSRRLPEVLGNKGDDQPAEDRIAMAREFHRWTAATADPMLELTSLRILSKLLQENARLSEALFYAALRADLLARYCSAVPLRLRLHRAALADYDFLLRAGKIEKGRNSAFETDYSVFADALIGAKAQTREMWRGALRTSWLAACPGEELPELPALDEGFEPALRTLCGHAEEARKQFLEKLGGGDRNAACNSLTAMFEHHFALLDFLNERGFNPDFNNQTLDIDCNLSATGKNPYEIHARATGRYQTEIIPRTRLDMLEHNWGLAATRDVLAGVLLADERLPARGAANLASFYESYRSLRTPLELLNEPLVHAGISLVWTGPSPDRSDDIKKFIDRAVSRHVHDYLEQRIQAVLSQDPMAPSRNYDGGGTEGQQLRASFEAGWQLDQAHSAVNSRKTTTGRTPAGALLTLNDVFTARLTVREDSEFFVLPEPAAGVDFETRASAVHAHFNDPMVPAGPPRFDKVLHALHGAKQFEGQMAQHVGANLTELIEEMAPFRALLDAGQIALSAWREGDFLPAPAFRSFAWCQKMLRSDQMIRRLMAFRARVGPKPDANAAEPQQDAEKLAFLAHMAAIACTFAYRPLVLLLLDQTEAAARAAENPDQGGNPVRDAIGLALYAMAAGDHGRAIAALGPVPAALRQSDVREAFQAEYLLAICHRRAGDEDAELEALRAATEDLELVRGLLRTRNQVLAMHELRRAIYEDYLGALYARRRYAKMSSAMRRYRGSSQMPIAALRTEPDDSELKRLVRETTLLYDVLSREEVWKVEDSNLWAITNESLWGTPMDRDASRATVMAGLNHIANILVDQVRPASAVETTEIADASDGLALAYFAGAHGVYRVASCTGAIAVRYSPIEEAQLTEYCQSFRDAIGRGEEPDGPLFELLLGDLPELAGANSVYVSPDGLLNLIPFQALKGGTGRYLIEDHAITYPSGAPGAHAEAAIGRRRMLVVGNPDGSLPAAEEEARAIAKLPAFEAGKPLLRGSATIENVRARLADADLVHFATHARANESHTNFGYLQLARWDRLYSIDLGGLPFEGKHVFLSACETRVGEAIPGEDVYGVADAFLAAGAPSVIATLWRIEDESCALFAERYYGCLAETGHPSVALARAARAFIANPELKAPFIWAGFNHLSAKAPVRSAGWS